jgi:hypothetical protein
MVSNIVGVELTTHPNEKTYYDDLPYLRGFAELGCCSDLVSPSPSDVKCTNCERGTMIPGDHVGHVCHHCDTCGAGCHEDDEVPAEAGP